MAATGSDPQGKQQLINGTATVITTSGSQRQVKIRVPSGAGVVYVGGEDVTTNSYAVNPNTADEFFIEGGNLYGIATVTTTITVFVSRRG